MDNVIKKVSEIGIVPVIKLKDINDAIPLAEALIAGNMPAAEVTFRAEGADKVIAKMLEAYPDMLVGAGTVINMEQAERAVKAGAKFVVSPGFDAEIVKYCLDQNVLPLPGCVTPSEIMQALKLGLKVVKFFPAAQYGGLATIKALSGPFNGLKFMPTGGVSLDNLGEFIANKNIAACGGSFMVADKYLDAKNWAEVTRLCKEATDIVKKVREA
ncbi:MAG: bifunctional 4-hydroxy-2-oxoglutarate aldolase/2-dehydro-3-deoxy-phosphogluconate aldolase [Firmicutes bacterium]|nr:bifunctional 4-hydroxy-2-oxoglutarate aldolase/2-dehydro-3-deoxy-phosphogluconate aldolase [Bacillota bacterium]